MEESIKKMNEIINSLVTWLNDYPNKVLTKNQKVRIKGILIRLENSQTISLEELAKFKSQEFNKLKHLDLNPYKKGEKKSPISLSSFVCDGCKKIIQNTHKENHHRKCKLWNAIHRKSNFKIDFAQSSKTTGSTTDLPGRDYGSTGNELKDQYRADRKADGSRDHFQIRDTGRFGSSSSYDDYGDESEP